MTFGTGSALWQTDTKASTIAGSVTAKCKKWKFTRDDLGYADD